MSKLKKSKKVCVVEDLPIGDKLHRFINKETYTIIGKTKTTARLRSSSGQYDEIFLLSVVFKV